VWPKKYHGDIGRNATFHLYGMTPKTSSGESLAKGIKYSAE
jgi:hypothetical protein